MLHVGETEPQFCKHRPPLTMKDYSDIGGLAGAGGFGGAGGVVGAIFVTASRTGGCEKAREVCVAIERSVMAEGAS